MRKIILLFTVATVAMVAGCTVTDYECDTYFEIVNQTGADIVIEIGRKENIYKSTLIITGEEQTIYEFSTLCGKNEIADDYFHEEENIQNLYMKVNGTSIPNAIWKRKYWGFTSVPYETFFKLILTDELIESVGFVE